MHGAGNDFILVNDTENKIVIDQESIAKLCSRRLGIGADGFILIRPSEMADFRMVYFNSDGFEGSMCGNGGRAAAVFAYLEGLSSENTVFEAIDGVHKSQVNRKSENIYDVTLTMQDVYAVDSTEDQLITNTGSPHLVLLNDNVSALDVVSEGRKIRNESRFNPSGINVNFLENSEKGFFLRTYERGVEDETLSCGTGVTAAAIAVHLWFGIENVTIITKGGDFNVFLKKDDEGYKNIVLRGPVENVFEGTINLNH